MTSFLALRASVCVSNSPGMLFLFSFFFFLPPFFGGGAHFSLVYRWPAAAFCRSAPFSLLRRVATLDLSEWLPNRTQQVGRVVKGPSYMFFDACAGTILHRRLLRFEPTFLARRPARWLLSSRVSEIVKRNRCPGLGFGVGSHPFEARR